MVLPQGSGEADIFHRSTTPNSWWGMGIPECVNESAENGLKINSYGKQQF